MFYCGLVGAGDIKIITALLITIPADSVIFFFAVTTFLGLPLAIFAIIYKWLKKVEGGITLPYGVAITGSYILTSLILFKVLI